MAGPSAAKEHFYPERRSCETRPAHLSGLILVSTREGWVHIFHEDSPDHYSEAGKVKTEFGAKTMALDPKTHNLLVDTSDFETRAGTAKQPNPRPIAKPGTFRLLVYGR